MSDEQHFDGFFSENESALSRKHIGWLQRSKTFRCDRPPGLRNEMVRSLVGSTKTPPSKRIRNCRRHYCHYKPASLQRG